MSDVFVNSSMFKLFYKFCVPNVISAAFLCSYYVIDGIFVGLYLGSDALAAMGLVMPFIMMCFALADMIAIGSSVQISIHLGQDKRQRAKMIFSASILLIFLLACSLAVLAYLSYDFLLSLLNISAKIKALAKAYDFSGGQIENISRKRLVDYIIRGRKPSLSQIHEYCKQELIHQTAPRQRIGFHR